MHDRAYRADDPDVVAQAEDLEEAREVVPGDPGKASRQGLALESACAVVPDEPVSPPGAPDRVEVLGGLAPDTVDRLSTEPRRGHSLEALTVEAEHRRAGPRHQDRAARKRLHPPEISALTGVELLPSLPVEMQHERSLALVGSHGVDVGGRSAADGEEGRRQLAREELPLANTGRCRLRGLFAGHEQRRRDRRQEHRLHAGPDPHGPLRALRESDSDGYANRKGWRDLMD